MKHLYGIVLTNRNKESMLMASVGGGVAVYPTAKAAREAAVMKFGENNPHVQVRIARIGVVVQQ